MKRSVLFILIFCVLVPYSEAQVWKWKRYQATIGFGTSQLFGDIGGFSRGKNFGGLKDLSLPQLRVDLNVNLKYRISQNFNARISLTYGLLHSSDATGSNVDRGFESSTSIFEPSLIAEYYFIKNRAERPFLFTKNKKGDIGKFWKSLDFYIFAGIGGAAYNVKGNTNLANYGITPGGITAVVPAGVGANLIYSPVLNFGIELGGRYSFSDNLDGYHSQYTSTNDVYYFLNFTITYKLKTGSNKLPSFR